MESLHTMADIPPRGLGLAKGNAVLIGSRGRINSSIRCSYHETLRYLHPAVVRTLVPVRSRQFSCYSTLVSVVNRNLALKTLPTRQSINRKLSQGGSLDKLYSEMNQMLQYLGQALGLDNLSYRITRYWRRLFTKRAVAVL
jgi:hypothetical protein